MMEKKIKHKHKDGKVHSHVGGDKKHTHETTKATVKVKTTVEDAVKLTYKADYTLIDRTIDDIKKVTRTVSVNDYATNNVYLILQDALKKVVLAEK
jgi:hypothetical protein